MNKKILSIFVCLIFLQGCAHCSKTVTNFDGKTSGINPYGNGKVKVLRTSYWGNNMCIKNMMKNEIRELKGIPKS